MVDSSNTRAMDIDLRLGFKEVTRFAGAALDGSDQVLLSMRKEDCRWIRGTKHGKEKSAPGT
jgi:hypothetical protein